MRLSKIDAAYLAGLIDGEGCVFINRNGKYFHAGLAINMTTVSPLIWGRKITKLGQIRRKKSSIKEHRDSWRWTVWSNQASFLLRQLIPYLKLKKRHALNLIFFQRTHDKKCYRLARKLNKRGTKWI